MIKSVGFVLISTLLLQNAPTTDCRKIRVRKLQRLSAHENNQDALNKLYDLGVLEKPVVNQKRGGDKLGFMGSGSMDFSFGSFGLTEDNLPCYYGIAALIAFGFIAGTNDIITVTTNALANSGFGNNLLGGVGDRFDFDKPEKPLFDFNGVDTRPATQLGRTFLEKLRKRNRLRRKRLAESEDN